MTAVIPKKRRFMVETVYPDLSVPRAITKANLCRGLVQLVVFDNLNSTRPRRWDVLVDGGYSFEGEDAKYFILDNTGTNVASVTPVSFGYSYDLLDAFGNAYRLEFNGARNFTCTIQRTGGSALTGNITVRVILFPFDNPLY